MTVLQDLAGGLIVSCQPVPGGPFDTVDGVLAFARAAQDAGATGLRIEGAANVAAVVRACRLPVIGLIKRDLPDSPVRITPFLEDVAALIQAGAHIIAVDATLRPRPVPVSALLAAIRAAGRVAMADCATVGDASEAVAAGADCAGSTMAGYTGGPLPSLPDLALVRAMASTLGVPVLAEGRYNTPRLAGDAIRAGAHAVVVGSAITRPEHVTSWFRDEVARAARSGPVLAFDVGGTKTMAALVQDGRVLDHRVRPTDRDVGGPGWAAAVAEMAEGWQFEAAAAAVTGRVQDGVWSALNPGVLAIPPDFPLRTTLSAALDMDVLCVNDAQAAAWGEYRHGAGQGQDMVFLTVSSGVGGGIVTQGKLWRGAHGLAGSLGQILVAGRRLEEHASGFAIAAAARAAGRTVADARAVFDAAASGASWAAPILDDAAHVLAGGIASLQATLDPAYIVVGGGVGLAGGFLDRVRSAFRSFPSCQQPELRKARLGTKAGVIGAAALAADL